MLDRLLFGLTWLVGLTLFFVPEWIGLGLEWSPVGAVILLGTLIFSFGSYVQGGHRD